MERLRELEEARAAAREVIARVDHAISSLNSASSWGLFDIFGGGLFASLVKRDKIKTANEDIRVLSASLTALNKELEDVNMELPEEVSDSLADNVFDAWFDNILSDILVQGELKSSLNSLRDFRTAVMDIIREIDYEIEKLR
ncbi:MAG: hypothetical protein Q4D52_04585 [Eubacteriales bacterium]|nr:hypothetical protein [Eubacteriales bacterium]